MAKRVYKDFSRKECANIAIEYARTHLGKSEEYFTTYYNISSSTFYSILHNAISKCMVSDEIAEKIRYKACSNSRAIAGEKGSKRSFRTYRRLLEERASFEFCKTQAIRYAKNFAYSNISLNAFGIENAIEESLLLKTFFKVIEEDYVSKKLAQALLDKLATYYTLLFARSRFSQKEFCQQHPPLSKEMLGKLLIRGIVRNLVSDEIVIMMRDTALSRHDSDWVYEFFGNLELERNNFKMGSETAL